MSNFIFIYCEWFVETTIFILQVKVSSKTIVCFAVICVIAMCLWFLYFSFDGPCGPSSPLLNIFFSGPGLLNIHIKLTDLEFQISSFQMTSDVAIIHMKTVILDTFYNFLVAPSLHS